MRGVCQLARRTSRSAERGKRGFRVQNPCLADYLCVVVSKKPRGQRVLLTGRKGAGWRGEIKSQTLNIRTFLGARNGRGTGFPRAGSDLAGTVCFGGVFLLVDCHISGFFPALTPHPEPQGRVSAQGEYFDCENRGVPAPRDGRLVWVF